MINLKHIKADIECIIGFVDSFKIVASDEVSANDQKIAEQLLEDYKPEFKLLILDQILTNQSHLSDEERFYLDIVKDQIDIEKRQYNVDRRLDIIKE